jgi:hypothetical protein
MAVNEIPVAARMVARTAVNENPVTVRNLVLKLLWCSISEDPLDDKAKAPSAGQLDRP